MGKNLRSVVPVFIAVLSCGNGGSEPGPPVHAAGAGGDASVSPDAEGGPEADVTVGDTNPPPDGSPPPSCGNGTTDPGEVCDGTDVAPSSCSALPGFGLGVVACQPDCLGYDVSACTAGATIDAASCSQQDVQAAIDAASDGDTVAVPAGDCTWTTITPGAAAVAIADKTIVVRGAGMGNTIIRDQTDHGWAEWGFDIQESEAHGFRLTGFTFSGQTGSINADDYFIQIQGTSRTWRLDNCEFTDWTDGEPIQVRRSASYGVIDNCTFDYVFTGQPIQVSGENDVDWQRPLSLGTATAVFVEDCVFTNRGANEAIIDSSQGARVVVRHNTVENGAYHNHGRDSGARDVTRSTLSYEVYENTFTSTSTRWTAMDSRGGTGVIWNNDVSGVYDTFMLLYYYCSCWGYDGSCPSWPQCVEYPCTDQIGRAPDADGDSVQDLEPLYSWGNVVSITGNADPQLQVPDVICSEMLEHVQEDRDYFNDTQRPGYVPYPHPHPLTRIQP